MFKDGLLCALKVRLGYAYYNAGRLQLVRAVLDSGSQLNFITSDCAKRFSPSRSNSMQQHITGVGAMSSSTTRSFQAVLRSMLNDTQLNVILHGLPIIVNALPSHLINQSSIIFPEHTQNQLADPEFHVPGKIDMLLGAEIFFDILIGNKCTLSSGVSIHHTQFGWIVTGKLPYDNYYNLLSLTNIISRSKLSFFTINIQSEELKALQHFQETVKQDDDGRFIVKLATHDGAQVLGYSRAMAKKRFLNLEKQLHCNILDFK